MEAIADADSSRLEEYRDGNYLEGLDGGDEAVARAFLEAEGAPPSM